MAEFQETPQKLKDAVRILHKLIHYYYYFQLLTKNVYILLITMYLVFTQLLFIQYLSTIVNRGAFIVYMFICLK